MNGQGLNWVPIGSDPYAIQALRQNKKLDACPRLLLQKMESQGSVLVERSLGVTCSMLEDRQSWGSCRSRGFAAWTCG